MRHIETPPVPDLSPVIKAGGVTRTLFEHRAAHGLTKYRLAQVMGVNKSWVTRIENGERELNVRSRRHLELLFADLDAKAAAGVSATEYAGQLKAA